MRKDHVTLHKYVLKIFLRVSPYGNCRPFSRVATYWRKGNTKTFQGFLDTGSELTLFPRTQRTTLVYLLKSGITVVSDTWSSASWSSCIGPHGSMDDPVVASPVPENATEVDMPSSWQNPHTGLQQLHTYGWRKST